MSSKDTDDTDKTDDRRRALGFHGEDLACAFMVDKGWRVRHRNYRLKIGEIDVIVSRTQRRGGRRETTVAIVEVKTKRSAHGPPPEASVDHRKRRRLTRLGALFLQKENLRKVNLRFDVVAVDISADEPAITHYPAAFDADGRIR